jgi:hypothetical protein
MCRRLREHGARTRRRHSPGDRRRWAPIRSGAVHARRRPRAAGDDGSTRAGPGVLHRQVARLCPGQGRVGRGRGRALLVHRRAHGRCAGSSGRRGRRSRRLGLLDRCRSRAGSPGRRGFSRRRHDRVGGRGRRLAPGGGARRKKRQRIEVALRVGRQAHAELHERLRLLRLATRADRPDAVALGDRHALRHRDRAEVRERHRIALGGGDRHAPARARDRARKAHRTGRRRDDGCPGRCSDVDAAVLTRGVRVRRIEQERLEDGAVNRPRPGLCCRRERQRDHHQGREKETTHRHTPFLARPIESRVSSSPSFRIPCCLA